jgi:hypothetical protein
MAHGRLVSLNLSADDSRQPRMNLKLVPKTDRCGTMIFGTDIKYIRSGDDWCRSIRMTLFIEIKGKGAELPPDTLSQYILTGHNRPS